ncbi:LamG domain-containing protein [Hyphomonadaceae bacterium ML37]|nr:LamG domain-containing protein [Hyphomonadaceae bacterium ML37]
MTSVSGFAAPLNAVSSAQASQSSAVASATSYGQRPARSMDAVSAIQVTNALSQRLNHLNQIRALERADGLVNVTLAAVEAIEDTLMEMRTLSANLQEERLSGDQRDRLTLVYGALVERIGQTAAMAEFGGRNLINPQSGGLSGDVALPGGMSINAADLRPGITGAISDIDVLVPPALENLRAAFDFEGSLNPVAWTNGFGGAFFAPVAGVTNLVDTGAHRDKALHVDAVSARHRTQLSGQAIPAYLNKSVSFNLRVESIPGSEQRVFSYGKNGSADLDGDRMSRIWMEAGTGALRLQVFGSPDVQTNASLNVGQWHNLTLTQSGEGSSFGDTRLYLDGKLIASVNTAIPMIGLGNMNLLYGQFSDLALWDRVLDGQGLAQATSAMKRGVHNWRPEITTADWASKMAALDQSLGNVRQVAQQYASASRSIAAQMSMQQRMTDIIDAGASRLVNRDIERVGALDVAAQVRTQLAQAMMQTQTGIMNAQIGLLSNSLALFDSINIGGFTPGRLSL